MRSPPRIHVHGRSRSRTEPSAVVVDANGLHRKIVFDDRVGVVAPSPDGRLLAAAVGDEVAIADIETGRPRLRLRGAGRKVDALAWTSDNRKIWGLADGRVLAWTVREATTLLDEPDQWFIGFPPSSDPARRWLVGRDGRFRLLDLDTGLPSREIRVDDRLSQVGGDSTGTTAYAVGERSNWIVSLADGMTRAVPGLDCVEGRPVLRPGGRTAYVPCAQGDLLELELDGGKVLKRNLVPGGARSVALGPRTQTLYVGSNAEGIFRMDAASGATKSIWDFLCRPDITSIAIAPDETAIVPVGEGIGHSSCSVIGLRKGGGWTWNHIFARNGESRFTPAAAFDETSTMFAYGHSNGIIELRPARNLMPSILHIVPGAPRDMVITGGRLFVVTRSGLVASLPVCGECLSNRHLSDIAAKRVHRLRELRLTG